MKTKLKIGAIALLVATSIGSVFAQSANAKISVVRSIPLSAEQTWQIVRAIDGLYNYSSIIKYSEYVGSIGSGGERWAGTTESNTLLRDRILSFNDKDKTYTYYTIIAGVLVDSLISTFKVKTINDRECVLIWWAEYDSFIESRDMCEDHFKGFMKDIIVDIIDGIEKHI